MAGPCDRDEVRIVHRRELVWMSQEQRRKSGKVALGWQIRIDNREENILGFEASYRLYKKHLNRFEATMRSVCLTWILC